MVVMVPAMVPAMLSALVAMISAMVSTMVRITSATSAAPIVPENATGGSEQDEDQAKKKDKFHRSEHSSFGMEPPWGEHPI